MSDARDSSKAQPEAEDRRAALREVTADGHFVVIKGRRWRATDPALPADVADTLRRELMSARRDVGAALRAGDPVAERTARDRVQRAKVGLGERGDPWWEQTAAKRRDRWESALRQANSREGPGTSRDDVR